MPISNLFLSTYHKCMCMTNSSQAVRIQFQFIEVPYNLVELTAVGHRNGPKAGTIGFFCRPFLRLFSKAAIRTKPPSSNLVYTRENGIQNVFGFKTFLKLYNHYIQYEIYPDS